MKNAASQIVNETHCLGDIARVFAGIGITRHEPRVQISEALAVIGVRDLQDGVVASREELDAAAFPDPARAGTYAVKSSDVLLTGRGTILKFGLAGDGTAGAIASGNVIVIRARKEFAVGGALFAILSSDVFRPKIEMLRRGATTLLSLSPKDLAKLEIDLPSLPEQKRIAAFVHESQAAYRTAIEAAEIRRSLARRLIDAQLFGSKKEH